MNETSAPARAKSAARASAQAGAKPGVGGQTTAGARAPADASPPAGSKSSVYRFVIPLVVFVGLVVVLAVGILNSRSVGVIKSPLIGKPAPAWNLPVLDEAGRTFGSKDLAGKWYVLNVWGSWCFACKDEHAALLAISRSTSVPIIGIDWRDDDADARNWLNNLGNPYQTITTDHDGHVVIDWGVYGAPETFLVNPQGVVVYKQIGAMTPEVWKKEFAARIPASLADRTS